MRTARLKARAADLYAPQIRARELLRPMSQPLTLARDFTTRRRRYAVVHIIYMLMRSSHFFSAFGVTSGEVARANGDV